MSEQLAPTAEAVLLHLCQSVVSASDEVSIEASSTGEDRVRFDVSVNKEDMGRVIGRRGRVAVCSAELRSGPADVDGVATEVEFVE